MKRAQRFVTKCIQSQRTRGIRRADVLHSGKNQAVPEANLPAAGETSVAVEAHIRYPSTPLDSSKNEFRLLYLFPGEPPNEVSCDARAHDLASAPDYEALSYAWGASTEHRSICVNGVKGFAVTDNLWAALNRLRKPDRVRVLWVDAVCINQQDTSERGSQVTKMGEIYRGAKTLLVWLGDQEHQTSWSELEDAGWRGSEACTNTKSAVLALQKAILNTIPCWWERLWIVQEFIMAPEPAKFCFEDFEMVEEDFLTVLSALPEEAQFDLRFTVCTMNSVACELPGAEQIKEHLGKPSGSHTRLRQQILEIASTHFLVSHTWNLK